MRRKPRIIQIGWTGGKPSRKGERVIEFVAIEVVVVDLNEFIVVVPLSLGLTLRLHRSERGEENTERGLSLPCPGFRSIK